MYVLRRLLTMPNFYAVHKGKTTGVFPDWSQCSAQVIGFKGAKFKKFTTIDEANEFVKSGFKSITKAAAALKPEDATKKATKTKRKSEDSKLSQAAKKARVDSDNKEDDEGEGPTVYTDGACSKNGRGGALAGYGVWWGDNHPMNLSCKLHGIQTNQRAEIAAISAALKQAVTAGYKDLTVCTDSMFVINCVVLWSKKWRRNGWKKTDGSEVVHKTELLEILDSMIHVNVQWKHVRGHKGIYGNEMADKLAVAGVRK